MGPCPSNQSLVLCPLSTAFTDYTLWDEQLRLPPLGAQDDTVTISGWSGGGFMANNFYVSYSDFVKGIGMIESGPYGDNPFFTPVENRSGESIERANKLASEYKIADPSNMQDKPVFIFSGAIDKVLDPVYQEAQRDFHHHFKGNVRWVQRQDVGHTVPSIFEQSEVFGPPNGEPKYDLAGNILKYLLTNLQTGAIPEADWKEGDTDWRSKGIMKKFYQSEYLDTLSWDADGLAKYGYIYYPYKCYDGSQNCKVHMFLHGCGQTVDSPWFSWKEIYYGGWLEYAAANNLILLLPQARFHLGNPFECFEITNYNGNWDEDRYATQNGVQIKALKKMLDQVTSPRSKKYNYGARNMLSLDDTGEFLFDAWRIAHAWPDWLGIYAYALFWGLLGLFFEG